MSRAFVEAIQGISPPGLLFNPWRDWAEGVDIGAEAPIIRRSNLTRYLDVRAERTQLLMIAEAAGYQGARFSGLAMTCERTLLGGKPEISAEAVFPGPKARRTSCVAACRNESETSQGFCEPTASVVWRELIARPQAAPGTVLWNVMPFHPHKAGAPLTNRTPKDDEVDRHIDVLLELLKLFPDREIVAVGETSNRHIARLGRSTVGALRHPAYGGAPAFRSGLSAVFDRYGWRVSRRDLFG